ncbi:MAG: glycoside hydrolase family 2 [Lachnospiraceae bacterium]|nr:glycoside hydrolase family 2 [Lachnospiraceae bacterium]
MNLLDAAKSVIRPHEDDKLTPLTTVFGERLDINNVLPEYPRPQMVRDSYINLNGKWNYAITASPDLPASFPGEILVPFSPEAALSGVGRQLKPDEYLWYHKALPIDKEALSAGKRVILHFGAVDSHTQVMINGHVVITHEGGYLPFEADITPYLLPENNVLTVRVQDFTDTKSHSRGKQTLKRGGIFYTAQSGIWQTVWLEYVAPCYIQKIQVQSDFDNRKVTLSFSLVQNIHITPENPTTDSLSGSEMANSQISLSVTALFDGKELCNQILVFPLAEKTSQSNVCVSFTVAEEDFHPWSPECPALYDLQISFGNDKVTSYFALRSFTIEHHQLENTDGEVPVFCLNHKPYFLMGVLDQGYWPDGLYTAPSDEALLYDITTMKKLGFNMLRKHIKVECARWYYHCDKIGMIVCQDMVNGGSTYNMPAVNIFPTLFPKLTPHVKDNRYSLFSRTDEAARTAWEKECLETVDILSFFPCIAIWVPFNEGWGQFDSERITGLIKQKDNSRLIDSASGWFDQGAGDFISEHNYFRPLKVSVKKWNNRALFLSEYGGFACHIKDHSSVGRVYGYKRYDSLKELQAAYDALIQKSLLPLQKQGLSGAVYTQLSDIEEEVNGILTYDRKVNKLAD